MCCLWFCCLADVHTHTHTRVFLSNDLIRQRTVKSKKGIRNYFIRMFCICAVQGIELASWSFICKCIGGVSCSVNIVWWGRERRDKGDVRAGRRKES